MRDVCMTPIGTIFTPHTEAKKTPVQPRFAAECPGTIEIDPAFAQGLQDIECFSHIYVLFWLDRADAAQLMVKPFLQNAEHGVFATRAPCRPNPIGMSVVRLLRRDGNILHIAGADMLNGTPVLDIKPYCRRFDWVETTRDGWQNEVSEEDAERLGRRGYVPPQP